LEKEKNGQTPGWEGIGTLKGRQWFRTRRRKSVRKWEIKGRTKEASGTEINRSKSKKIL